MIEAEWPDYQVWLFRYAFLSSLDWTRQRKLSRKLSRPPLFTLLTPVYNIAPDYLYRCVESVLFQTYPHWQLLLVDDASTRPETRQQLRSLARLDDRIQVHTNQTNLGICATTNRALSLARGRFCAFLDHDDRIAANALFEAAQVVNCTPEADIIYSDRDLISVNGGRFMHLFKPDWAPETILSSNYLCHLTIYRTSLLRKLQGLDQETEGSQDHDLILRAEETDPCVVHIPKILYHWRQHPESVALNPDSKQYAYDAATLSVQKALQRRGLRGTVEEIPGLWRGNYRVRFEHPATDAISLHRIDDFLRVQWRPLFQQALVSSNRPYLVFLDARLNPENSRTIEELTSWFQIDRVAMTTGLLIDSNGCIVHAGLLHDRKGAIQYIYQGKSVEETPGYMAWAASAHNVSLVHPGCFAIRRRELEASLKELKAAATYPLPLTLSLVLRSRQNRIVYTPFARFSTRNPADMGKILDPAGHRDFYKHHQALLSQGDPYFSPNLTVRNNDISLNHDLPCFGLEAKD